MNRRSLIKSALAGVGALFLPQKVKATPVQNDRKKYKNGRYIQVKTDKEFFTEGGQNIPLVTLANKYGGRVQIANDDSCYVLYLRQSNGKYKSSSYWFSEAHKAVSELPDPLDRQAWSLYSCLKYRKIFHNNRLLGYQGL